MTMTTTPWCCDRRAAVPRSVYAGRAAATRHLNTLISVLIIQLFSFWVATTVSHVRSFSIPVSRSHRAVFKRGVHLLLFLLSLENTIFYLTFFLYIYIHHAALGWTFGDWYYALGSLAFRLHVNPVASTYYYSYF